MLQKIISHARAGTLLKVAKVKVSHLTVGNKGAGNTYYGSKAADYDAAREGQSYWDDQQRIAEGILNAQPDGLKVLDVPFGTGRFVPVYARKGFSVTGVELSPEMVQAGRKKHGELMDGIDIHIGDAGTIPLEDSSVELTVCFRFLSEIISSAEAKAVLRELRRVTNGTALLDLGYRSESAPSAPQPRDRDRLGVSLSRTRMEQVLNDAGFEVDDVVDCYPSDEGTRAIFVCH